jgi:sugar/nucleoside kinase (ribokinase family)
LPRLLPPAVVDARDPRPWRGQALAALKANRDEARLLGPRPSVLDSVRDVLACAPRLLASCRAAMVAITLDAQGVVVVARGEPAFHLPGRASEPERSIGAGDAFAAGFGLALGCGAQPREAAVLGSRAAQAAIGASTAAEWQPETTGPAHLAAVGESA